MYLKEVRCEGVEWIYPAEVVGSCEHGHEPSDSLKC
jgi:hypothetical protein